MKPTYGRNSATGNSPLRVLYDGWTLANCPGSPAAVHLLELFETLPPGVEAWLALPDQTEYLPTSADVHPVIRGVDSRQQLSWEQVHLPALARSTGADLLHLTTTRLPLMSPLPCLVSPAAPLTGDAWVSTPAGFSGRLARALGRGGLSRSAGLLWPGDLAPPAGPGGIPLFALPPRVHSTFFIPQPRPEGLPDAYIYVPASPDADGRCILRETWRQVTAALHADCGLVVSGLPEGEQALLAAVNPEAPVAGVAPSSPAQRAALFQHAAAALLLSPVLPWGDSLLQALACGCPLVAEETRPADRRAGPAAYLTPPGDARLLASALITLVLEESVSHPLGQAARQRAAAWGGQGFAGRLWQVYRQVAGR